uniref:Uncharacterized protein n=1 Tax=Ciona savignyi TaxID=51511 RepID=H2Z102_CIOSA
MKKWMKLKFNFQNKSLVPCEFKNIGRGMLAKRTIYAGEPLISVPQAAMIGVNSAYLECNFVQNVVATCQEQHCGLKLSGVQVLCLFLIAQRRKQQLSTNLEQNWRHYIQMLPQTFTHPVYWEPWEIELLPKRTRIIANKTIEVVKQQLVEINEIIGLSSKLAKGDEMSRSVLWKEYIWAWCCVNTRCVYSTHDPVQFDSCCYKHSSEDNYYLVPYLDLLNHCSDVGTDVRFNQTNKCYELINHSKIKRYSQAFISYGALSNTNLLLEYGFVADQLNKHDIIHLDINQILSFIRLHDKEKQNLPKIFFNIMEKYGLDEDLSLTANGPSWTLLQTVLISEACCICGIDSNHLSTLCMNIIQRNVQTSGIPDFLAIVNKATNLLTSLTSALRKATHDRITHCQSVQSTLHVQLVLQLWRLQLGILESALTEISVQKMLSGCIND